MTLQDMFTKIVTSFLTMPGPAISISPKGDRHCMYRSPTGLRCFIGALIPDEFYRPDLERLGVDSLDVRNVLVQAGVIPADYTHQITHDLLALQLMHDRPRRDPEKWKAAVARDLLDFAHSRALTVEPTQLQALNALL